MLSCEDEITGLRERLSELEHEISGQQQRGLELKGEIDRHESRIQFNEERLRECAAQGQTIFEMDELCRAAKEYQALAQIVLKY